MISAVEIHEKIFSHSNQVSHRKRNKYGEMAKIIDGLKEVKRTM